jgi:hypothetical protein
MMGSGRRTIPFSQSTKIQQELSHYECEWEPIEMYLNKIFGIQYDYNVKVVSIHTSNCQCFTQSAEACNFYDDRMGTSG